MSQIVLYACESCGSREAEHIGPLDLGDGARMIDLCPPCQLTLALPRIEALFTEYGAPIKDAPRTKSAVRRWDCPVCEMASTARGSMISHLHTQHGVPLPEASTRIPPDTHPSSWTTCEHCGYLLGHKGGLGRHLAASHSETVQ